MLEIFEVDLQSKDITDGGKVERFTELDGGQDQDDDVQDQDIPEEEDEDSGENCKNHLMRKMGRSQKILPGDTSEKKLMLKILMQKILMQNMQQFLLIREKPPWKTLLM